MTYNANVLCDDMRKPIFATCKEFDKQEMKLGEPCPGQEDLGSVPNSTSGFKCLFSAVLILKYRMVNSIQMMKLIELETYT